MITNCINCCAPIQKEKDKCPYCGTTYDTSGFKANIDDVHSFGEITICGETFKVYIGSFETHSIGTGGYQARKRKFTLIER